MIEGLILSQNQYIFASTSVDMVPIVMRFFGLLATLSHCSTVCKCYKYDAYVLESYKCVVNDVTLKIKEMTEQVFLSI